MIESYLVDRMFNNEPFLDELATSENKVSSQWQKLAMYYDRLGPEKLGQYHDE